LAVVIQMTWLASIGTSANSSVKLRAVSCSSRLYSAPSGSYCASAAGFVDLVEHDHRVGILALDQGLEHLARFGALPLRRRT
jgi:hypothetical protein